MNPITLPTSPETRAALEKAGWYLLDPRMTTLERWCHDEPNANILLQHNATLPIIGDDCDFFKVLEFAAILDIAPPGYEVGAPAPQDTAGRYLSVPNPVEDVLRAATLYVEEQRLRHHVDATDNSQDYRKGLLFKVLGQAVDALQGDALSPHQAQPHPSEEGGPSPSPLDLLKSLYACAVNSAKVEPELERQIRQAIGEDAASAPALHPDGRALLNMVQTGLDSYDTPRITRELQEFFADGEADEPREEGTP